MGEWKSGELGEWRYERFGRWESGKASEFRSKTVERRESGRGSEGVWSRGSGEVGEWGVCRVRLTRGAVVGVDGAVLALVAAGADARVGAVRVDAGRVVVAGRAGGALVHVAVAERAGPADAALARELRVRRLRHASPAVLAPEKHTHTAYHYAHTVIYHTTNITITSITNICGARSRDTKKAIIN